MQGSAATATSVKSSNLEALATRQIFGVFVLLVAMCFTGATAQAFFNSSYSVSSAWYLNWSPSAVVQWVTQFFYLLLLHASFVPVSLYVSMAMVRFGQSYFMINDLDMYYAPLDYCASVRTMTLNEELGQIAYIFSDKTGTLTCNNMIFRKMSIHGISYGQGITEIGKAAWKLLGKSVPAEVVEAEEQARKQSVAHVTFYDPLLETDLVANGENRPYSMSERREEEGRPSSPLSGRGRGAAGLNQAVLTARGQSDNIKQFWRFLSVCHEAVAEKLEDGQVKISAPNPDDEALVCAAAYFGYEFKDRKKSLAYVLEHESGEVKEIEILYTIPFTSSRKRMSVIIRDIDDKVKIITKGADSAILSRLDPAADAELTRATVADIDRSGLSMCTVSRS